MRTKTKIMKTYLLTFIAAWCFSIPLLSHAQMFKNQFIQFKLPDNWNCRVEGTEWVCQSDNPRVRKESIIIFAAKVAGKKDTLKEYHEYLKKPREIKGADGKPLKSDVTYTRKKNIQGHTWIDSIHKSSEIPGFITRYLATTYQGIAILLTYSVLEPRYNSYSNLFSRLVESVKPLRETKPITTAAKGKPGMTTISISDLLDQEEATEAQEGRLPLEVAASEIPEGDEGGGFGLFILLLLVAAGGVYIYFRRKRQQKGPPPEASAGEEGVEEFE